MSGALPNSRWSWWEPPPDGQEYSQKVQDSADTRVRFLGGVWDQDLLDELYANALVYWHGHSVGGTNPSLLRAIGAGTATNAFDVNFNREVLGSAGEYFRDPDDVARLAEDSEAQVVEIESRGSQAREIASKYDWDLVADRYEELCYGLHAGALTHAQDSRNTAARAHDESRVAS